MQTALRATMPVWSREQFAAWAVKALLGPLQLLIAYPSFLFLAAFTAMLLRHPDIRFYKIDRVTFGIVVLAVVSRALLLRQPLLVIERATWPILGLTLLALCSITGQPFDPETWSVLASKLIVPFTLFHLAGIVFTNERHLRQFEIFALVILAYLSFTAIAFLCGARWLIFPRFILDETLGIQGDRARAFAAGGGQRRVAQPAGIAGPSRVSQKRWAEHRVGTFVGVRSNRDSGHHDAGRMVVLCRNAGGAGISLREPKSAACICGGDGCGRGGLGDRVNFKPAWGSAERAPRRAWAGGVPTVGLCRKLGDVSGSPMDRVGLPSDAVGVATLCQWI